MNSVIIHLQKHAKRGQSSLYENTELEMTQALAIARLMRDKSSMRPLIICDKDSFLNKAAREEEFDALPPPANPINFLRLMRWVKRQKILSVLGIGEQSLSVAKTISRMHDREKTSLYFAFYLTPPKLAPRQQTLLAGAKTCFCGSEEIAGKMEEAMPFLANIRIVAPGLPLDSYTFPAIKRFAYNSSRHFVFGMAESLMHGSGALLVTRAMAAMWQKDDLPPWEVRMFGSGPRFQEIFSEAAALGVLPKLAILPEADIPSVSADCDAWLAPGTNPFAFPDELWSGPAAGLPTICSRTPLHRERLDEFDAALKVNESNPQELAKAMIDVIQDRTLAERLVQNGDKLRPHTSLDAMAVKLCGIMQNQA